jgi:hypothetical protein
LFASHGTAQAPADTARRLLPVVHEIARLGRANGESIWPGFRPDTIPMSFVLQTHGDFLCGWRGTLPVGYTRVPEFPEIAWRDLRALGAASTGTTLDGHPVAQVVINSLNEPELVATALHEAFHVFEGVSRRPGKRFGSGENSFYVATYPIFDAANETGFALESAILGAALDARTVAKKRELAQDFVGVRRARHAEVSAEISQFDQMSEMNEGLAQYAFIRGLHLLDATGPTAWKPAIAQLLKSERARVSEIMTNTSQSFRLRYYATGPAMALIMDDLTGPSWKRRLVDDDLTLQDALALVSGVDSVVVAARRRADSSFDLPKRRAEASALMDRIRLGRMKQVDSLLAQPGITLVISADSLPAKDFGICSFDPQNHLQVSATMQLQTRWWQPCAGRAMRAEFNVPSVHDATKGTVTAVIGAAGDIKLTIDGQLTTIKDGDVIVAAKNVVLEAPRASVTASKATVSRTGDRIVIRGIP